MYPFVRCQRLSPRYPSGQTRVTVDLSLGSFHVVLPQEPCPQTNPQLIIMAEDASQKPVQVKLVLLGTFPVLAVQTPQEQRPLCTQRPNAPCKGLTSFFSTFR